MVVSLVVKLVISLMVCLSVEFEDVTERLATNYLIGSIHFHVEITKLYLATPNPVFLYVFIMSRSFSFIAKDKNNFKISRIFNEVRLKTVKTN